MIQANPKHRISLTDLKKHAFFKSLNWKQVEEGRVKPPEPVLRKIEQSKMPMSAYDSDE